MAKHNISTIHPSQDVSLQQDSLYSQGGPSKIIGAQEDSLFMSTAAGSQANDAFVEMTQSKYLFPVDMLHNRKWFLEL